MSRGKLCDMPHIKHSIGLRFRNSNFFIIISTLLVVVAVVTVIVDGITEDMSKKYAQFYSLETVEKFDLYLSKELNLMEKIAHSRELINWFADEGNLEKKAEAYKTIMGYADVIYGNDFYLGIEGSLNEYTVNKETSFEAFMPFEAPLSPDAFEDQWYFNCLNQDNDYTLNIDVNKYWRKKRFWINY